jgi:hypothetical protein
MTEERSKGSTSGSGGGSAGGAAGPQRAPGYRGSLPPRHDRLARPWLAIVAALFVLIFVLAFAGLPSRLFPAPSVEPIPSFSASPSFDLAPSLPASPATAPSS